MYLPSYYNLLTYPYLPLPTADAYPSMSTYLDQHHLPTYLPLPIPKYHYIIAADPGAGIGLVYFRLLHTTQFKYTSIKA